MKLKLNANTHIPQIIKEVLLNALFIQLVLESLSHRSAAEGLMSITRNPLMFLCSIAMLSAFLSIGLLLPKRHFGYLIVDTLWLWLGVVNFILMSSRTTPLTAMDFKMLTSVFTVIGRYLNTIQLVLFFIAVTAVIVLIVFIGIKMPRTKWKPHQGIAGIIFSCLVMVGSFNWALATGNVSRNFGNIANAYADYGFAYSFATSVVDRGIQRPSNYSTELVSELLQSMNVMAADAPDHVTPAEDQEEPEATETPIEETEELMPNIIMIQLESVFDPKRIKALSFSEDPVPNLTALRENYSFGYVTVPSIGAGTANTEFEILSGMSLDYFGAGEYPYKTILSKSTVESYPYVLSDLGYHSQAIHNNMGTFYSRCYVYPRLGFDGFTSIEYMENIEYNPLGWSMDSTLIPEIMKSLESTEEQDFVFTVSVQPHGKYPSEPILDDPAIAIYMAASIPPMNSGDSSMGGLSDNLTGSVQIPVPANPTEAALESEKTAATAMNESTYNKYLYYVNQVYETDAFVGDLIKELEDYPEPVVVVFYGDHMPTLDITEDDLRDGTPFQTEYVMWDNMGLERVENDLMAYQLGSMVMERLGYDNGLLNKFHQQKKNDPDYEKELELLQYDMLYGNMEAYGGKTPYKKKKMTMGVDPITIEDVAFRGEAIFITGHNFTAWSEAFLNNVQQETIFVDEKTLIVSKGSLEEGTKVKVSQITDTGRKLSSTATFKIGGSEDSSEKTYFRTNGYVR